MKRRVMWMAVAMIVAAVAGNLIAQSPLPAQSQSQPPAQSPASKPATRVIAPAAPVNINTATTTELETLPGIGPAMAARIVEYRQKNGGFKKVEDLMNVKGIGEKSFLKLKPLVVVAPPKTTER